MKLKILNNSTAIASLAAFVAIASFQPHMASAQDYNDAEIELGIEQLDMPDPVTTEAPEPIMIQETTPADMGGEAGTVQDEVMEAVNVDAPSEEILQSEVTGETNVVSEDPQDIEESDNNEYFDSFAGDEDLTGSEAPRRVDPRFEPGSKYIVVRKDAASGSQQAMLTAANRALSLGRYSSALEMFETLRKRNPKDKNVLMGLGIAQQNMGFSESAINTYRSLLKLDRNNVDAKVNLLGLLQTQNPKRAHQELMHLWEHNPRDAGVAAQIGLVSAELGNTDDAVRFLGIASSIEPTNSLHVYNMAVIYDRAGAKKDALKLYEKALKVDASRSGKTMLNRETVYDRLAKLRRL